MEDRFKFRFWCEKDKTMYYVNVNNCIFTKQRRLNLSSVFNSERYIPMQCIGIKDKNRNLVYEGDILSHDNLHEYLLVRFNPAYNILNLQNTGNRYLFTRLKDKDTVFEIIGNIYENKELIKKLGWKNLIGEK